MEPEPNNRLPDRLRKCAELWASTNGATLARLGRAVVNDSSFFNRLGSPQGVTTVTLERFASFLGAPANWTGGDVPAEVREFVHITGVSANSEQVSTGKNIEDFPYSSPGSSTPGAAAPGGDGSASGESLPEAAE